MKKSLIIPILRVAPSPYMESGLVFTSTNIYANNNLDTAQNYQNKRTPGASSITSWEWDFGDGYTLVPRNFFLLQTTKHIQYDYTVSLYTEELKEFEEATAGITYQETNRTSTCSIAYQSNNRFTSTNDTPRPVVAFYILHYRQPTSIDLIDFQVKKVCRIP